MQYLIIIIVFIIIGAIYYYIKRFHTKGSFIEATSNEMTIHKYDKIRLYERKSGISRIVTFNENNYVNSLSNANIFNMNIHFKDMNYDNDYLYMICVNTDRKDININHIMMMRAKIYDVNIASTINFKYNSFEEVFQDRSKHDISQFIDQYSGESKYIKHTPSFILGSHKHRLQAITMGEIDFIPKIIFKSIGNVRDKYISMFIQHNNQTYVFKLYRFVHRRLYGSICRFKGDWSKMNYDDLTTSEQSNIKITYVYDLLNHRSKLGKITNEQNVDI
jgi:hypothetical protein